MPIPLLMSVISVMVFVLMQWVDLPVSGPEFSIPAAPPMLLAFFVGALGEEVGRSQHFIDALCRSGGMCSRPALSRTCCRKRQRPNSRHTPLSTAAAAIKSAMKAAPLHQATPRPVWRAAGQGSACADPTPGYGFGHPSSPVLALIRPECV